MEKAHGFSSLCTNIYSVFLSSHGSPLVLGPSLPGSEDKLPWGINLQSFLSGDREAVFHWSWCETIWGFDSFIKEISSFFFLFGRFYISWRVHSSPNFWLRTVILSVLLKNSPHPFSFNLQSVIDVSSPDSLFMWVYIFFFFVFCLFLFLFFALGLRCCMQAFSSCGERGLLFVVVCGLLIVVASLVVEHGL